MVCDFWVGDVCLVVAVGTLGLGYLDTSALGVVYCLRVWRLILFLTVRVWGLVFSVSSVRCL